MFLRSTLGSIVGLTLSASLAAAAWTDPENLGALINSAADEVGVTLNAAGTLLVFDSDRAGGLGKHDLYKSVWDGSNWGAPAGLGAGVNTSGVDYAPSLGANGLTLYFTGNDWDLYSAVSVGGVFGSRTKITALSTANAEEWAPAVSYDGNTMLFTARNRFGGLGKHDIWTAQYSGGAWQAPAPIGAPINTSGDEYAGSLSASGDSLFFAREGDLYLSVRVGGVWQTPELLGATIQSDYWDTHPVVSPDGTTLYFASERPGGEGGYDLWRSTWLGGVDAEPHVGFTATRLLLAGPNPCRGAATLRLELLRDGEVALDVYALGGQRVRRLDASRLTAGAHGILWDGADDHGRPVASGAYIVRARGADWALGQKLLLIR